MKDAPASCPKRSNCIAVVYADSAAIERLLHPLPRLQRDEGHCRTYSRTSITVSQTVWMPHHVVPGQPARLHSPSAHEHPPETTPGLPAPERKARSQSRLRPRKLRVIRLSLRSSRVAAACRLRRSCRRNRAPVPLPRSGCPVRRSRHPAALTKPPRAPPPAAPRGILRSRPAAPPRSTPAKRRAIFINQSDHNNQPETPTPQDCLILRCTSDQPARCALRARSF